MSERDEEQQPLLGDNGDNDARPTEQSFGERIESALRNPKRLNGLEKALAAGLVLFVLLTATGFGLFAGEATKLGRERKSHHRGHGGGATRTVTATSTIPGPTTTSLPPTQPPKKPGKDELCLTPDCTLTSAGLLSRLDTNVDPCEDFYNFANGGWLADNPIPEGSAQYGTFQAISDRNQKIILSILESPIDKSLSKSDQHNLENLKNFWSSCNSEDTLDKAGSKPLFTELNTVIKIWRGETVQPEFSIQGQESDYVSQGEKQKWDKKTQRQRLTNALAFLHSRGIDALFSAYPEGDVGKNPKMNSLWLSQAGLSLPSRDYYDDKKTVTDLQQVVETVLAEIYGARKEKSLNAKDLAKGVINLEKKLAAVSLDVVHLDDPIATYNPYHSSALQQLFPSISFPDYFATFFPRPRYPDPVIVTAPTFFANLTQILDDVAPDVLEAYFAFQTAEALGPLLGSKEPIRKELDAFSNRLVGLPADAKKPRKEYCLDQVSENYGFLVGRYFVQRAFPGRSREYAEEVIGAVIQAFRDRLPGLSWLDDVTREKAREKVDAISHKIGYPTENPDVEDAASVERYYSIKEPIQSDEFFDNVLRSRVADERRDWVKVGRERGAEFDMPPALVNAYYDPSLNEIVFPAGILQKPFFAVEWPEYLVFGAFGSVAGHELSHSLDQAGRLYDKDGKLTDWWTNTTNARFEERTKCFVEQYSNYTVLGPDGKQHHVNGKFTDGEDTADAGGLAQTWKAWKTRKESDPHGKKYNNLNLPGLGEYSQEQLFFIAFAQGWARAMTPAEAQRRIRIDPHSPTQFRVRGPLSNNEEFAKAFNCPVGSPMNNKHKCSASASSSSFPTTSHSHSPWNPLPTQHDGASGSNQSGPDRVQSVLDRVLAQLDGFEDDMDCPLCLEEMDLSDLNFKPCPCGYQICRFCYHHIKENLNNRCPACRTPYDDASVEFKAIKPDEMKRLQAAKKLRDKRRKDEAQRIQLKADVRVRQRTQVHVQGMTTKIANEDTLQQLKSPDSFGQYGKILKLFMSKRSSNVTQPASTHPHYQPVNVYINYRTASEASNCIANVDGTITEDGHKLKAIFGTTRYCPNYLKGIRCHNDSCTLAHEQGEEIEGPGPVAAKDEIFTFDNETISRAKTVLPSTTRKLPEASLPETASWASKDAPRPPSTPIILNPHLPPLSATLPKPPAPRTISIGKPKNHPLPARPSSRAQREAANSSATANAAASSSSANVSSSPTASPALAPSNPPSRSVSISLKTTSKSKAANRTPPPEPETEATSEPAPPSPRQKSSARVASPPPPLPSDRLPSSEPPFADEPEQEPELVFSAPPEFPSMPTFPEFGFGEGAFSFSLNLDVKGKGRATEGEEQAPLPLRDFGNVEGFGRSSPLDLQNSNDSAAPFSPGSFSNATNSSYIGSFDPFAEPTFGGGSLDLRSPSPSPPSTAGGEDLSRRSSRFGFARRGSSTVGKNAGDLVSALARSAFPGGLGRENSATGGGVPFAPPGIGLPPRSSAPSAAYSGLPPLGTSNENQNPSQNQNLWPSGSNPSFPPGVLRSLASPNTSNASSPQLSPHNRNGILPPPQHHFGPPPGISGPPPSAANSALPPPPGIGLSRAPIPAASFPLPPPAPRPTNSNSSNVAKEDLLALIAAAQATASKQQQQQQNDSHPPSHPFFSDPAILNARLASSHQNPQQQAQANGLASLVGGGGNGGSALDALFAQAQQQQQQQQQQAGPYPPGMRPFGLPPQQGPPPPGMYRQGPPGIGKV
ncbi:CCR4-NOT core ubiquitin-protein ligase subunit MOT2 [Sporobolomyces salmoneus]|uniref:CCR4-NOT core ubiquitin-protein ligase subunit MOT2 n=1 Tax=Sporobolomyces salmoneus TaxID=183962 RepID=UPI00317BEA65